ncbi:MAG: thioredoxin fold domain-containing protein [Euryarchaeota archaeon]|nr:thioredoxin fold domain-containing protein [Euryarchaeota archaeon]
MYRRWILLFAIFSILSGCTTGGSHGPGSAASVPPGTPAPAEKVETGDLVWIDYTARVEGTGEVFDTTYEEVGSDPSIKKTEVFPLSIVQSLQPHYEPLGIIVGTGQTIKALEDSLVGMGVGQEKSVTVSPEEGYGPRSDEYVITIPRSQEYPVEFQVAVEDYRQREGRDPSVGDTVRATPYWDAVVTKVEGDTVTLRHTPEDGKEVDTPYGPAVIYLGNSTVEVVVNPPAGSFIQTNIGTAKVVSVDEENIVLDYNHPLAGKTLVFDVVVRDITKKDTFAGWNISFVGYEEGLEMAAAQGKPIVMDLYWSKCPHCKRLDEETFPDPRVTELRDEFVWVREEVYENRTELGKKYGVESFPTLIILDSEGREIKRLNGFMNAMVLRWELEAVLESLG